MNKRSIDRSVDRMLRHRTAGDPDTVWDRFDSQTPHCAFGEKGLCCRICYMGPCRIKPGSKGRSRGICGATAEVIVARNFARMVAAGAAAHSEHGRTVAETLLLAAEKPDSGYSIRDPGKLKKIAGIIGIESEGKPTEEIAADVARRAISDFGRQEGEIGLVARAPETRQALWRALGVSPRGIDREIVEMLHRTSVGVDLDHKSIMLQAARTALADGWGGSMYATELQDILFGTPSPIRGKVNLGVLSETDVNIVVHGHEPILSEMLVLAVKEKDLVALARSKGATGINLTGICCTANEILLRHGLPIAGNMLQQELAVSTGAVEAIIVDVQCIMPSLPEIARCYHTKLITTSPKGSIPEAEHFDLSPDSALDTARKIVEQAVLNFPNRKEVFIPEDKMDLVAGFSHEAINYMLGGTFRGSYTPLNDNVVNGRIKGVAAVVGCGNPRVRHDECHVSLTQELIANDILVVQTGCSAIACAKAGFLRPETAQEYAGKGLAEVCKAVGMPPVLHSGSCVDNSRILIALSEMVRIGGLGNDISDLPVAGAAPEWMSEKAISIGQYFVASGVFTVFGVGLPAGGDSAFARHIFDEFEGLFGGKWAAEADPGKIAALIIDHINAKRERLGISKARDRVLYDMEMRRGLDQE
jgi:carbon-monoxide dehydrogenase catalytic subunit